MIKKALKKGLLKAVIEVLKPYLTFVEYLAILAIILGVIYWLYPQIDVSYRFIKIALALLSLVIYTLLFAVLVQHAKLTEKQTAADKLKEDRQKCENPNLKIESIKQTIHIEGPEVTFKREFIGRNYSNEKVPYFVVPVGGDKPLRLNKLCFKANEATQKGLKVMPLEFKDWWASDFKILKIRFKHPLKPKDKFDLCTKFVWPDAIDPMVDYIMFTVTPYKFVDKAEFVIIFDANRIPKQYYCYATETCKKIDPTKIEPIDENDTGELKLTYSLKYIGTEDYKFVFNNKSKKINVRENKCKKLEEI